jgi:thymidylate kinase
MQSGGPAPGSAGAPDVTDGQEGSQAGGSAARSFGVPAPLARVFEALDREGIRWCLLRPPASLEQPEGDIDILVEPGQLRRVRALLEREHFVPIPMASPDLHMVDYDPESDRFLWLHVQPELRLGAGIVNARAALDALECDPLPRPGDAWLLWILILHGLLDKSGIAERHRAAVRTLAGRGLACPDPLGELAVSHGLAPERVLLVAAAGDWEALSGLAKTTTRRPPALVERLRRGVDRWLRLWLRRGLAVAVLGPDGAGKTTLVTALQSSLPFPTRVLYMGLTGGRLPKAESLRIPGLVLAARLALLWTRYAVGLYHRARGRIVLFDRYPFDAVAPSGTPLGPFATVSRQIQGHACPAPDLLLLLDAPGATLHRRSGEYDPIKLEAWRAAYRGLARRRTRLEVLDAERPADLVRRDAQVRIWRAYGARWRGHT